MLFEVDGKVAPFSKLSPVGELSSIGYEIVDDRSVFEKEIQIKFITNASRHF